MAQLHWTSNREPAMLSATSTDPRPSKQCHRVVAQEVPGLEECGQM
eukprot:CAMPEP_0183401944 /NCGR_PEP_ID=MMETSP0370-20130417/13577_1 /TAXON_ID=268820 /ORGANISM="Peridinium aciculiferum, Strain PAER-2" /LENGTH=45 /DNA_ID= /DNA_START= /DNA_END= /DNA_ORIENTATION=